MDVLAHGGTRRLLGGREPCRQELQADRVADHGGGAQQHSRLRAPVLHVWYRYRDRDLIVATEQRVALGVYSTYTSRYSYGFGASADTFGPRLSGSTNLENALDWIMATMRTDGIANVTAQPVNVTKVSVQCLDVLLIERRRRGCCVCASIDCTGSHLVRCLDSGNATTSRCT